MNLNILNIYINRFLGDFIPIVPFLAVFFSENNLSLSQISFLFLILAITVFTLELPTGVLADRIALKTTLLTSRILKLCAFVAFLLLPSFEGFALGMFLWGAASAFDSGAFQSYLYNFVKTKLQENDFEKVYSRSATASLFGLLSAVAISTQINYLGFSGLQMIGVVSLSLCVVSTFLYSSIQFKRDTSTVETFASTLKQATAYIRTNRLLLYILMIGIAAGGIKGTLDDYSSLLLDEKQIPLMMIGFVLFGLEVLKTGGALLSGWLKVSPKNQTFLLGLSGVAFILCGIVSPLLTIALLALILILDAILWVHNDASIQRAADDNNRATLASFKNFATEILAACVLFFMWLSNNTLSLEQIYLCLGSALVFTSLFLLLKSAKVK